MGATKKKTILLVEDEAIIAMATAKVIRGFGYEADAVFSGEEAVELVSEGGAIDLVIMDIDLGKGMDGPRAAQLMLERRNLPIVFRSSHSESEMVEKVRGITRYGYVIKNSGNFVLRSSIEMAFELFDAHEDIQRKLNVLKASEDRFQLAMNELDGMLWTVDRGLRFTLSRGRALSSLGLSHDQVLGWHLSEFLGTEDPDNESIAAHRRALLGEGGSFEYRHIGRDFRVAVSPMQDIDGNIVGVVGIGTDVTERRKAEEALKREGERLRNVIDGTNAGTWEWNIRTGEMSIDERSAGLLGYSHPELPPIDFDSWMRLKPPEDREESNRLLTAHLQGELDFYSHESRMRHRDGSWVWIHGRGKVVEWDGEGRPARMLGTHIDITARKKAELLLKESEEKFSRFFNRTPYPAMIIDMEDGRLNEVNEAMIANTEYARGELIGKSAGELGILDPDSGFRARNLVEEYGGYSDLEIAIRTKSGKRRIGLATGQSIDINGHGYLLQTILDFTERMQAEKALRESELKYRSLIEYASDIVFCVDGRGEYQFANKAFATVFGKEPEYFIGKTFWDIYPKEHADRRYALTRKIFETGEIMSFEIEVPLGGKTLYYSSTSNPIRDESGKVILALSHGTDITERRKAEERIKRLLEEKELILKEVHHRIKNNMTTMMSLLSLQADTVGEPRAVAALKDAENRLRSMESLYDKLYRTENPSSMSAREYLPSLVEEVVNSFPNAAAVRIETRIDDFQLGARELSSIGIIVNEIIVNSMKHAFVGREGGLIRASASKDGGLVAIAIGDDGIGIRDPAESAAAGGFGLRLVESLAKQLNGRLRIESNGGTTFVLEFEA